MKNFILMTALAMNFAFANSDSPFLSDSVLTPKAPSARSGSDVGGNISSVYLSQWCDEAGLILEDYLELSRLELNSGSNYKQANVQLLRGFEAALTLASTDHSGLFTLKALERGRNLLLALGVGNNRNSSIESQVIYDYASNYYDFIIDEVASGIDVEFFIPYHSTVGCDACNFDIAAFEFRFVEYAKQQLKHLLDFFVYERPDDIAAKAPKKFLVAAEYLSGYVAQDVDDSLWAQRFSCASRSLRRVNSKLAQYNSGNKIRYPDDRIAINLIYRDLVKVLEQLEGC